MVAMEQPTPSQLRAIHAADRHVLVTAGAGTGKTSTVVARILYLLGVEIGGRRIAQPLALGDLAAITFTNAAAADLKDELRKALRAAGLRSVAAEVDVARVGTIHAFCGDILREFALRRGASPAIRILQEGEALALAGGAVHDVLLRAIETGSIPGLDRLFAVYPVAQVEQWVGRLAGESARLERIAGHRDALGDLERTLVALALESRAETERRLAESGAVDFDRMIGWTRDLLRHDPPARAVLRRRIRTLIVDEFQDVDPVQKEIAYLLGDPASRRADTTRLMLVGDPKQSIYRFRRADVTVWREVEADFAGRGLGEVLPLDTNFRSVDAVLALVDASVGRLLDRPIQGPALGPYEVPYLPVTARDAVAPGDVRVELLVVTGADNVDQVRQAEIRAVARRVRELGDAGVPWREIALVFGAWSEVQRYEAALRRAGVPTYTLRAEGFYGRREVVDLILALQTIRDPGDDLSLMGFLRSPFVGLEDETLLAIALQTPAPPYWEHLSDVKVREPERLERGVRLLWELVGLRDRIATHELLETLLQRTGYLAHLVASGPDGRQPLANVRKFLRVARGMRDRGVGDLLRAITEIREREDRVEDERLFGAREDVVTLTSIHSAKGLEWEVVLWCDLLRGAPPLTDRLLVGRDTIALKDPDAKVQAAAWQALEAREKNEQYAERKRTWYVAATRAKKRLILAGFGDGLNRSGTAAGELYALLGSPAAVDGREVAYEGQGGKRFRALLRTQPAEPEGTAEAVAAEFAAAPLPEPVAALPVAVGPVRHSATSLTSYTRCARRHWFRYALGLREPPVEREGPEFGSAVARGQIVHDVLERLREEADVDALLEVAIGRWDEDAPDQAVPPGRRYRDELRREILSASGHPAYRALDDRPGARRELGFVRFVDTERRIEGKADLVAPGEDGLGVLDVKTGGDAASARRKADGYALQRRTYVSALSDIGGLPVNRFTFLFSGAGIEVSAPVTEAERATAAAEIARLLDRMGREAPALTQYPWECRFCGFQRVRWCPGVGMSGGAEPP
jgi:ATP-dependent helicase/nuclease subunit A